MSDAAAAEFAVLLKRAGIGYRELISLLLNLGYPASRETVAQRVRRWRLGEVPLSGEMVAFLTLLERVQAAADGLYGIMPRKD